MGKRGKQRPVTNTPNHSLSKPPSRIFLLGFGILFFLAFIFAAVPTIDNIYHIYRLKNAIPVKGKLSKLDSYGVGGGRGGGSTAYVTEYEYEFNGRVYLGDRMLIQDGMDSIGSLPHDLYNRLENQYKNDKITTVYINMADPSISSLDITIRYVVLIIEIIFPLPFLFIACCLFYKAAKFNAKKI